MLEKIDLDKKYLISCDMGSSGGHHSYYTDVSIVGKKSEWKNGRWEKYGAKCPICKKKDSHIYEYVNYFMDKYGTDTTDEDSNEDDCDDVLSEEDTPIKKKYNTRKKCAVEEESDSDIDASTDKKHIDPGKRKLSDYQIFVKSEIPRQRVLKPGFTQKEYMAFAAAE